MFIEREVREELNALSKEVFRVSSKWQSFLDHGINELVTETKTETIPGENGQPDTTQEIKVPVLKNGVRQYKHKTLTLEEVRTMMVDMKKNMDEIRAKMKAAQEQRELEKQVHEHARGSVRE